MRIQISRDNAVSIHEQLAAQLVYLIGTGQLRAGALLPSVRALAQRLGVHRNTVSGAYQDPTLAVLVEKGRGKRFRVRDEQTRESPSRSNLDAIVDAAAATAHASGYTLREVHERLSDRLAATRPDHVLVVSDDADLCVLMAMELRRSVACPVDRCSPDDLRARPLRAGGAVVLTTPASLPQVEPALRAGHPLARVRFASVDDHIARVRQLRQPSVVAVVSVSQYFLEMARALLAPAVGRRHAWQEYRLTGPGAERPGSADLVFCDAVTAGILRTQSSTAVVITHSVIAKECLTEVASLLSAERPVRRRSPVR